jgi:UDP-2-acetamido-3-amino-2,3-dideoxy-glucuronate N-acetyltransferase
MLSHISNLAHVSSKSIISDGVSIWDYSQICENAVIGVNTKIGRNVYIDSNVKIGDNCKIQNNALIYDSAELHNGVFIGPGVILTNDRNPRAVNYNNEIKDNSDWNKVGVTINEGASVGAGSICVAPLKIGSWALVGAGSVVIQDVPDYALVVGNPAKQIGWVGPAGVKLKIVVNNIFECPKSKAKFNLTNNVLSKVIN